MPTTMADLPDRLAPGMTTIHTSHHTANCTCAGGASPHPLLLSVNEAAELLGIHLADEVSPLLSPDSVNGAAELLRIHRTTVYDLLATGQLRSTPLGRRRLIPRVALEAFVAALDQRAEREAAEQRAVVEHSERLDGASHRG